MLVLSRKECERLVIDGNIVITIVRISGGNVRLGIEAPPEISVKREELLANTTVKDESSSCAVLARSRPVSRAKMRAIGIASPVNPADKTITTVKGEHLSG